MNESGACLAITEKRAQSQRPGGCVGLFFQLFDWNRRFAKKKLFSKKLLAPARAKLAAKNLGGDEKMPKAKLHLIADENTGGFSNMKRNGICKVDSDRRHEMKAPSLVARLMGLESMPASSREKPKKASVLESVDNDEERSFIGSHNVPAKTDLSLEKGTLKLESRPQKLLKTGPSEVFQFKNVLSRSRKHQHPKLDPPVKSPRVSSARNVSRTRLIDVATRILEPGLQATNRAKCSLTYPGSMRCSPKDEVIAELTRVRSPEPFNEPGYNGSESQSIDVTSLSSYEQQLHDFPLSAPNFAKVSMEQEKDTVLEKTRDLSISYKEGNSYPKVGQEKLSSPNKSCKTRTQAHDRMSLGKDRVPSRAKLSEFQSRRVSNAVGESKDFVSLNRNLSGRTRPRVASNSNVDDQRNSCNMRDDSLPRLRSPARKRRSVNGNVERSRLENERNLQSNGFTRREMRANSQFRHQSSSRVNCSKDSDVVSFSFNSPLRNKTSEKMKEQKGLTGRGASHQRKLVVDGNNGERHFQEPCPIGGDALSALLEQKLKELTSQEEDELTTGVNLPKRSTAVILQELITALNAEQLNSHDFLMSCSNTPLQAKAMNKGTVTSLQDGDHLSPGSVLEASFSNDSCFSSSMDESSGPRIRPESIHFSHYQQQPVTGNYLSDSATSWSRGKGCTETVSHLVNHISQVLQSMNLARLTETKITHATEVIFNSELLFGNAASFNSSYRSTDFLVGPFLLYELERFVHATWPHHISSLCLGKNKAGLLRGFLFDSMIECVDSRYGRYGSTGYTTWSSRVPLAVNVSVLVQEIDEDVRKWTEMVGKVPDEIVEWEMSHGLGKWTDFDAEVFEAGGEIDRYILDNLVEEILLDL